MVKANDTYAPWKGDYVWAWWFFVFGFVWLAVGCLWVRILPSFFSISFTLVSVAFFYKGLEKHERGKKRKRGIKVEKNAIEQFKKLAPENWDIKENFLMDKHGNIDLSVRLPNREICTVEIKSWAKTTFSRRTMKVFYQSLGQKKDLRADRAFIWLPQALDNKVMGRHPNEVVVVEGSAGLLIETMQQLMSTSCLVRFPRMPGNEVRSELKARGFRWDSEQACWKGRCPNTEIVELKRIVKSANGMLEPLDQMK